MREERPLDTPEITTERLLLRRFRRDDAEDIFRYCSDPEVARMTSWSPHESLADTHRFLDWARMMEDEKLGAPWAMVPRESDCIIGAIQLSVVWPHLRGEVGYWLGRPLWGQGLATEATHAVLAYAFDDLELHRVEARCEPENVGSERVMQKVGMRLDGVLREHVYSKGRFRDMKLYAILRDEWRADAAGDR